MQDNLLELQKKIKINQNIRVVYNLYNYPILNYLVLFREKRIFVPEYQRGLVWEQEQKELLIDSMMINLPIGNIFLNDRDYLDYEIVDGQQRLMAIWDYVNDRFTWKGLKYSELPEEFQRRIEMFVVSTYITNYSERRNIIELYYRINWSGVQHTIDELIAIDQQREDSGFIHKDCGGIISFDSFGNWKCTKCLTVSKDKTQIETEGENNGI